MSGGSIEQLLRLSLHVEASVLMGLVACDGGDALHKIENALGRATFLPQDRVDDLAGLGLRENRGFMRLAARSIPTRATYRRLPIDFVRLFAEHY